MIQQYPVVLRFENLILSQSKTSQTYVVLNYQFLLKLKLVRFEFNMHILSLNTLPHVRPNSPIHGEIDKQTQIVIS